ncbi:energy-coupling factor ABC transporter permease [Congregibacter variabilis]|uniref:Energy-coupling factor ABC transporter permease n=1 Tax=Congregibacter variabilis TaxID=3081200 RepID=A0ABZ0I6M5_9GAMM|nr:energy-coupling factor ABC transporter permease [Congregibacter sp. IMCC43200]
MHVPAHLVPNWILAIAGIAVLLSLGLAVARAQWSALSQQPWRMHLVAGGAVACLLLWLLNIHLVDGLVLHFLGVTTLSLLVGWSFSVLGASFAVVGLYALQGLDWTAYPLSVLLCVLLPATTTRILARLLYRPSLKHPFVYILGAGFAGGGLVMLLLALAALLLFWSSGLHSYLDNVREFWPLLFLLMFSEGFINGMCVTAFAIFYPNWMKTFDDQFYFDDER